jgi:Tfp pilus assembly protein FimV
LTHTQNTLIRPIQLAGALAVVVLCASSSHAANINLQGLKSSFTYTPFAGESLERIIAKTMPNTELKQEIVADAFRALNPQQFSKEKGSVTQSNLSIKVPNHNQLANLIENQASQKKPQNMLTGTTPAVPKVNPKTESWVRFPAKMVALTQKMENWIRYPGPNYSESTASAESKTWVRYLGGHVNTMLSGDIANSPTADWVRFPSASSQNLAISTSTPVDQSEWVRYVAKN